MNADDLNLDQPLHPSSAPRFAESFSIAARLVETVMGDAGFVRTGSTNAEDVPQKSKSRENLRLTYHREHVTAQVDLWDDDCQFTDSRRCVAFRPAFTLGKLNEAMPFNRHKWGQPSRQQWRQRTDEFVRDLRDQLDLLKYADEDGRLHGVVVEVQPGYGFIHSPSISRLFFHKSDLSFPWHRVQPGLAVSFVLTENEKGRKAAEVELSGQIERAGAAVRDHATAGPGPGKIRLVEDPPGADEQGMNVGRVTEWQSGKAFGFVETLLSPHLFLHRSGLRDLSRYGPYLIGRAVRFQFARAEDGRLSAINAELLPEGTKLKSLFFAELERSSGKPHSILDVQRRFRLTEPNSFSCTNEKRPMITVAALRDIIEEQDLLFVHTRWTSLASLSQPYWLKLAQEVAEAHFLFGPPSLIYLSTQEGLYRLGGLQDDAAARLVSDVALKGQLEAAAPHMDD